MLPTFETLVNFPVVIKKIDECSTDYIRIHETGVFEIINVYTEAHCRLMAYGIDGSKNIEAVNEMLIDGLYSNNDEFKNQLNNIRSFIPDEH